MTCQVIFEKQAKKELENLKSKNKTLAKRIILSILRLKNNSNPVNSIELIGVKGFRRIRVGKYRIIYKIQKKTEGNGNIIYIVLICKRDDVYKIFEKIIKK